MAVVDWRIGPEEAWAAALRLRDAVERRHGLPDIDSWFKLDEGEVLHANLEANCWWYGAADVVYEERQVLVFGSLGLLGLSAAATALGNRRRRAEAAALAAPQWRVLGCIPVMVTSERLMLPVDGAWTSLWLDDVLQLTLMPAEARLELIVDDRPPIAIGGQWAPYLCVVLAYLMWSEVLDLDQPVVTPAVTAWGPRPTPDWAAS